MTSSLDERRHSPGSDPLWSESFRLDFAGPDGTGGFVRLGLYPNLGQAWWWTYVVTSDRLMAVRDHEVALPRTGLEVRAEGLWADLICETPLEHWSVGLEAFGVALDDPADSLRGEWGERLPVGLDLSWEALGPPGPPEEAPDPGGAGYAQPGRVEGDLLVGPGRTAFEGWGWRSHRWGIGDWWTGVSHGGAFTAPDGTALSLAGRQAWWRRPPAGVADPATAELTVDLDAENMPRSWRALVAGEALEGRVLGVAPVPIPGPDGRMAALARALCLVAGAGFQTVGWSDHLTNLTS